MTNEALGITMKRTYGVTNAIPLAMVSEVLEKIDKTDYKVQQILFAGIIAPKVVTPGATGIPVYTMIIYTDHDEAVIPEPLQIRIGPDGISDKDKFAATDRVAGKI